jgi:hypothetical protein
MPKESSSGDDDGNGCVTIIFFSIISLIKVIYLCILGYLKRKETG